MAAASRSSRAPAAGCAHGARRPPVAAAAAMSRAAHWMYAATASAVAGGVALSGVLGSGALFTVAGAGFVVVGIAGTGAAWVRVRSAARRVSSP